MGIASASMTLKPTDFDEKHHKMTITPFKIVYDFRTDRKHTVQTDATQYLAHRYARVKGGISIYRVL